MDVSPTCTVSGRRNPRSRASECIPVHCPAAANRQFRKRHLHRPTFDNAAQISMRWGHRWPCRTCKDNLPISFPASTIHSDKIRQARRLTQHLQPLSGLEQPPGKAVSTKIVSRSRAERRFSTPRKSTLRGRGLNDVLGQSQYFRVFAALATTTPNVGNHSIKAPLNIGIADAAIPRH